MLLRIYEILCSQETMTEKHFLEGESRMWWSAMLNLLISETDRHTVE